MLGIGRFDVTGRRAAWRFAAATLLLMAGLALLLEAPAQAIFGNPSRASADGVKAEVPRIATDSRDNALIVWSEGDSGAHRIQAAFRAAGGDVVPLGFLSAEGGDALEPSVVFDEHDNALVVWTRYEGPEGAAFGRIQAAFRPAGGSFGAAQTISGTEPGVDYYGPHADLDESAAVVWTRAEGAAQSVQAGFRPKGGGFGAAQTLSGPGFASEPQVALDERGNALAVWTEELAPGEPAIVSAARPRTGSWTAPARVSPAGLQAFTPRIAVDSRNNALAIWIADADPADQFDPNFIQRALRPAGGSFGAAVTISAESGTAFDPQLVFDERDNALAVWARSDVGTRIEASFRPRDGSFAEPQALSPLGEDAYEPRIAVDESAGVVWSTQVGDSPVRVQGAFRHQGGTFGGPQTLSEPGQDSFEPDVAVDEAGNVLAVWTHFQTTDFPVVEFSFRPRVGSFGESSALTAAHTGAFEPQVATDRLGNTIATWTVDSDVTDPFNPTWVEAAFAPVGGAFGAPERLSGPGNVAYEPRVAFENDGDATVTWTEDENGRLRVHASFRPAGNGWVPAAQLSPDSDDAFAPQVSAGRGTVVVWSETDGADATVEAAVKPEHESFLAPQTVSRAGEEAHGPQVAVGEDGTAVATWYAGVGDHVAGAIGRASAAGFELAATLSPPGMAASEPHVAVDDRGNALAAWTAGQGALIQSAYRPRRAGFAAAQDIASDGVFEPQVAFDESGNALAAWTRFVGDEGQIETAFRPWNGSFGAPAVISATGEQLTNYTPRIAADDSAAVVWTAETPAGFLRVQSSFRPKDGAFGPVQTLTGRLVYAFAPQVAVDERGNVRAVWALSDQPADAPTTIQSAFRPRT